MSDIFSTFTASLVTAVIGGIFALLKGIRFVHEGEMGIKLRFGRAIRMRDGSPKVIPPGFVLMIPFVETLKRHHVRQQTLRLDHQKVMIGQGLIFNVSAIVIFRVKDIYRALFEIDDLDNSLEDLSMGILRDVLASKEYEKLSNMKEISEELLKALQVKSEEWGAQFIEFKLTDCAPSSETAPLLNAKIGVKLKVDALKDAAQDLGVEVGTMSPVLAAALVGVPLVASVTGDTKVTVKNIQRTHEAAA